MGREETPVVRRGLIQKPHSLEKVNDIIVNYKNSNKCSPCDLHDETVYLVLWKSYNIRPCSVGWRADQFEYPLELLIDITAREERSATVSHLYQRREREREMLQIIMGAQWKSMV